MPVPREAGSPREQVLMDVNVTLEPDRPYDPPGVESVLTAEELTREIQYAGQVSEDALVP
jgi:hypothetical protein